MLQWAEYRPSRSWDGSIKWERQERTTKASETAKRMCVARLPFAQMARMNSRKGGFCPDSSASELPAAGPRAAMLFRLLICDRSAHLT